MRTVFSTLNNHNGSVIVVAIIILALLTILGVSSTNTSTLEVRIATNSQDYQLDFYVEKTVLIVSPLHGDVTLNSPYHRRFHSFYWTQRPAVIDHITCSP